MTLTTRTTRKAPWAVVLTALLAVLALVGTTLAFTSAANADEGKVWICHADVNGTNGPGGPQSDNPNGQPNLGQGGTGGEFQIGFNLIEISVSAWENAHMKLHPNDFVAYEKNGVHACTPFQDEPETYTATKAAEATFCWEGAVTTVSAEGTDSFTTEDGPVAESTKAVVDSNAQAKADAALATLLDTSYATRTPVPEDQICTLTYSTTTTVQASTWICLSSLTTSIPVTGPAAGPFPVGPQATPITTADIAAVQSAHQGDARTALVTYLGATYPGYVETIEGADCTNPPPPPESVTAVEAATVAPVLPATVAEEPEVVAVPAPATVPPLPATVPAGDGSGTPTVPASVLALLALGATALAVSTVHLVRTTR